MTPTRQSHRARALAPRPAAALALALCLLLGACGLGTKAVDDPALPYSFSYPEDFTAGGETEGPGGSGFADQTVVATGNGRDLISVQTQELRRPVTPSLLPRFKRELVESAARTGSVQEEKDVEVAGIPGVQFTLALDPDSGAGAASWTYLPKDRTLYWINCQWQEEREAVLDGCDTVLESFEVR